MHLMNDTTGPLPANSPARDARERSHHAFVPSRMPRREFTGSLIVGERKARTGPGVPAIGPGRHSFAGWVASAAVGAVMLGALSVLNGCGYSQDVPTLPAGAKSIFVAPVQNLTEMGELDVRLQALLRRRLLRQAHVAVNTADDADLVLSVSLTSFSIQRTLDPAQNTLRSFVFALSGRMRLSEFRTKRSLADSIHTARVTRYHEAATLETTAVRDEGIEDVLEAFVDQVERALFNSF